MLRYGRILTRNTWMNRSSYVKLKIVPQELNINGKQQQKGVISSFFYNEKIEHARGFHMSSLGDGEKVKGSTTTTTTTTTRPDVDHVFNDGNNHVDQMVHVHESKNASAIDNNETSDDPAGTGESVMQISDHHHHHTKAKYSLTDIERMYKSPKSTLHDIYQKVTNELAKNCLKIDFKQAKKKPGAAWSCTIKITWPRELLFTTTGNTKSLAGHAAALRVLHLLENEKKLRNGNPIVYSNLDIKKMMNEPDRLKISEQSVENMRFIVEKYEQEIQDIIENKDSKSLENTDSFKEINESYFQPGAIIDPVGRSNPIARSTEKLYERNRILQARYEDRMILSIKGQSELPIREFKENILQEIENNQVVVIKGDTGCGKTTQVPQYIMDSFAGRGQATDCNIIVSQPRRISAISLAERIAEERREQIGDVVGYQVRLTQELPNTPAGILFCTTGILLRKLQFNPGLQGCSHVILDEAHERTINTDMALVLLKRAMKKNKKLKVIIMSATINADLFQNYFHSSVVQVPGKIYPVKTNFIEDIDKLGLRSPVSYGGMSFDDRKAMTPELLNEPPQLDLFKMAELIAWITMNKPPGAILCFLPGWGEIAQMKKYLEEYSSLAHKRREILVVPLHSKMSHVDQKKIFTKARDNVRKIVLSTDIAETGITVTDVVYVVDSCTHRQIKWHEKRGLSSISNEWASRANIIQRKGRAGRVGPGTSYHFITREMFDKLHPYPIPEIKRSSLEKCVLDGKTYSSDEKALDFLGSMPEAPAAHVIAQAVDDLIQLGALDYHEKLTPLGKRIALFTVHPKLSKAILYSSIFNCVSPIVTIAAAMSAENDIFTGVLQNKEAIRQVKMQYHPTSDHSSIGWLYQQWHSYNNCSRLEARDFCFKSRLYPERMFTLSKVRKLYAEHLVHARMLENFEHFLDYNSKINKYTETDELVRGVLLSGLDQLIYRRDFDMRKGQVKKGITAFLTECGNRATITPDSVNFKRKHWPSPYLTYVRSTHSEERRTSLIRETSIVSPLTVFLFSQAQVLGFLHEAESWAPDANGHVDSQNILFTMKGRKNVKLLCNRETAHVLLKFRDIMWTVVRYMVANQGLINPEDQHVYDRIDAYKDQLLQVLGELLNESAEFIDNPDALSKNSPKED